MSDHRDGYRLVNRMFPLYAELPERQQAILERLLLGAVTGVAGSAEDPELAEETEIARAHFRAKLGARDRDRPQPD